ncbi:MAG: sigma-70 family RNA polymerase sigma factor, partial [Actinomycetota bacterium]|nr:sigma-70 family RNA polymerase sigma factor [Actinomycetota bacterium]
YDRHNGAAFSLARRILGASGSEDAVQEAFLNLWRSARRYDEGRGSVRLWLLGMVRNRSIDAVRSRAVHERRRAAVEGIENRFPTGDSTEEQVIGAERSAAARAALERLPAEQRQVLELAYYGGWTQLEIAERLGLPVGTVKARTRLGLDKLRVSLDASVRASG